MIPPDRMPLARLSLLVVMVAATALGLALISLACWRWVPPLPHDAAFAAQFTLLPELFYPGQPAKNAAYQIGCLSLPFLLAGSFFATRIWIDRLSVPALRFLIGLGLALQLLLFAACLAPLFYDPHPPFEMMPPFWQLLPLKFSLPYFTPARFLSITAVMALGALFISAPARPRYLNRVLAVLVLLWLVLLPTRFYAPSEIRNDQLRFTYHLNPLTHALSQSENDRHLLVDFPHIYGGYGEILAPMLRLFPRSMESLLLLLAIPSVLSVLFLLVAARGAIREPRLLLLCGLALLSFEFLLAPSDPTYSYATARAFCPALGLLGAVAYFRRRHYGFYLFTSATAAFATIWNLDSGVVFWVSWLAALLAEEIAFRRWQRATGQLLIQVFLLAAGWTIFWIYLRLVSGHWPHPAFLFYFQKIVVQAGYFCLGLAVPDMWITLLLLYVIGLAVSIVRYGAGRISWRTPVGLMLSLLGLGLFSYFMGRSAESNLVAVCYPGVLLFGVLLSELQESIRDGELPAISRRFLLPFALPLFWWTLLLAGEFPELAARGPEWARHEQPHSPTPLEQNAAFVRTWTQSKEPGVLFLSYHSGIYYHLTGTTWPLLTPGPNELLFSADMNVLIGALREKKIAKLFVEQNFYDVNMYRPDIYEIIAQTVEENYRPVITSSPGQLTLYIPR